MVNKSRKLTWASALVHGENVVESNHEFHCFATTLPEESSVVQHGKVKRQIAETDVMRRVLVFIFTLKAMVRCNSGCLIGHDQLNPNVVTTVGCPKHAWWLPVDYFASAVVFKTNFH